LEGQLRTDRYEHEGQTRYFTKVVATQMQMLDRKTEDLPSIEVEVQIDEE
jgi:single-stranded DNA-binding protein